jgi:hypothetical protein
MNTSPDREKNLERFVHQALRELPTHRAPRSLESRVLAELSRRAALPWWRQDFAHWPVAARGAFLVSSAALAAVLVWVLGGLNVSPATETISANFAWIDTLRAITGGVGNLASIVFRSISPIWLYGAAIAVVGLYATLFGLGTAAYRTLYANR